MLFGSRIITHRRRAHRAYLWALQGFQSRVRTTRTSSRNTVWNNGKAGEACLRPPELPTRAAASCLPYSPARAPRHTMVPGALSRSTAQPNNVEANVGAASRQRCAQLWSHRPRFQTGKKEPRGTAWSYEKRRVEKWQGLRSVLASSEATDSSCDIIVVLPYSPERAPRRTLLL